MAHEVGELRFTIPAAVTKSARAHTKSCKNHGGGVINIDVPGVLPGATLFLVLRLDISAGPG